jgi:hypothetical protein
MIGARIVTGEANPLQLQRFGRDPALGFNELKTASTDRRLSFLSIVAGIGQAVD